MRVIFLKMSFSLLRNDSAPVPFLDPEWGCTVDRFLSLCTSSEAQASNHTESPAEERPAPRKEVQILVKPMLMVYPELQNTRGPPPIMQIMPNTADWKLMFELADLETRERKLTEERDIISYFRLLVRLVSS